MYKMLCFLQLMGIAVRARQFFGDAATCPPGSLAGRIRVKTSLSLFLAVKPCMQYHELNTKVWLAKHTLIAVQILKLHQKLVRLGTIPDTEASPCGAA